jgi:hypothetical protein
MKRLQVNAPMKHLIVGALFLLAQGLLATPAAAQYKWQTPEGTTVYSDVPPPAGARLLKDPVGQEKPDATLPDAASDSTPSVELPYGLKIVNGKFPVVLYTSPECAPCAAARQHLVTRGIPFAEKSVVTSADFEVFKTRGFNENSFPAMAVGREKTVGFESGAYDRLLDGAEYPRSSRLPPNYRQAAAEPMTPPQPQKLNVIVQREGGTGVRPAASAGEPGAIEAYRRQNQTGSATRAAEAVPPMRF